MCKLQYNSMRTWNVFSDPATTCWIMPIQVFHLNMDKFVSSSISSRRRKNSAAILPFPTGFTHRWLIILVLLPLCISLFHHDYFFLLWSGFGSSWGKLHPFCAVIVQSSWIRQSKTAQTTCITCLKHNFLLTGGMRAEMLVYVLQLS